MRHRTQRSAASQESARGPCIRMGSVAPARLCWPQEAARLGPAGGQYFATHPGQGLARVDAV
ncbi:hypothetical protein [Verminephrobacter eiseniae]|uniref:hypothetical protein n=1 Tax=Verminephrobacter eiseniae TaxID=364317 RepID=UPI002236F70F|nr:hypothetical protein [Verminephrobacter eiseniae]